MYSIIATTDSYEIIKKAVLSVSDEIIFKRIGPFDYNGVISAFEEASRITCTVLILDIDICSDAWLLQGLKIYRQARPLVRIILFAPGRQPGDIKVGKMFNMGIYDIVAPELPETKDDANIEHFKTKSISLLKKTIESKPANIADALRWDINISKQYNNAKVKNVKEIPERTILIEKGKIIGTVVIAVIGTMNRIGTTHTSISIACFLKGLNNNVCIMEAHESQHFNEIKNSYQDVKIGNNMFSLDGIDFYPYNPNLSVLDVIGDEYNYVILDMGVYDENNSMFDEFRRANVKIIVSGTKDWELSSLEKILEIGDKIYKNKYYFTFSDKDTFEFVCRSMDKLQCYQAPYNPNPFQVKNNKECISVFKNLLKEVLPYNSNEFQKNNLFSFIKSKLEGKVIKAR